MVAFVVLNYINFIDTQECVQSIHKFAGTDDYKIIIVDNGSPNESFFNLKEKFINDNKIILIQSKENLGFAKGNNLGFIYAKENLYPDFIVLCNNDTCLIENNFFQNVASFYKRTNFGIMGPSIKNKDGYANSNPQENGHIYTKIEIKRLILRYIKCYIFNMFYLPRFFIKENNEKKVHVDVAKSDVLLHGCFLVFSKNFIDIFDGLDPRTFMYLEEDILYLHAKMNNLTLFYDPEITILHKESGATIALNINNRKKQMFLAKNTINSLKVYSKIIDEYELKERGI